MSTDVGVEPERALLGAMLLSADAIDAAAPWVTANDYQRQAHGHVHDAAVRLRAAGHPVDAITVVDDLRAHGLLDAVGGPTEVVLLTTAPGAISSAATYARIIAGHSASRRLRTALLNVLGDLEGGAEAGAVVDRAHAMLDEVDVPTADLPRNVYRGSDLARLAADERPWVIDGLLRVGWRLHLVAREGAGKTLTLRLLANGLAHGIHPFNHRPIPPMNVLVIDCENPEDDLVEWFGRLDRLCADRSPSYGEDRLYVWWEQGGIDLRSRRHRSELEALLRAHRPALVCAGPLRKLYRRRPNDRDDTLALEVQAIFDDLRVRYGFALALEDHAPHVDGATGGRKMRPAGSANWLGWAELGMGLEPDRDRPGSVVLGRFRVDRVRNAWPSRLDRGAVWPWDGVWDRNGAAV